MPRLLFPVLAALLLPVSLAAALVPCTDFGLRPGAEVTRAGLDRMARHLREHPGTTVSFPPGDYRFPPQAAAHRELFLSNSDNVNPRNIGMLLEGVRGATILGRGARLLFSGAVLPIALLDCQDVAISGFEVDWIRPTYSQGEVLAADGAGITLRIDPARYPFTVEGGRLLFVDAGAKAETWDVMEFDPGTGGVACGTGDAGCLGPDWDRSVASVPAPATVRLQHRFQRLPRVGAVLVFRHSPRDHAGAFLQGCRGIRLADLEYRHTAGLGILAQYCQDLSFDNVNFRPTPGSGRLFSGHDDGFHISNCKGLVQIQGCAFEGLLDDPINVHGTSVKILKVSGSTLRCRFMHEQSVGLKFADPGDQLSFLDHRTLLSRGLGAVKALRRLDVTDFDLELAAAPPPALAAGDALENLTWTPEVAIRRCVFGRVRARGLLLTTPRKAVVEDCTFRSSGAAILISGDANGWYESGAVRDVLIRHNRFENCLSSTYEFCRAVISIDPVIPEPGPEPFHRGIRIQDNLFVTFDKPILWARSAGGLSFTGNTIQVSADCPPWNDKAKGLSFLHCSDVEVRDNTVDPAFRGRTVEIRGGRPETIRISGWEVAK